jgi:hypothetical protein
MIIAQNVIITKTENTGLPAMHGKIIEKNISISASSNCRALFPQLHPLATQRAI